MSERDEQIVSLLPLVHRMAGKTQRRFGTLVDFDDLYQEGCIGAIAAVDSWDGRFGTLEGWASIRVEGRMVDYVRHTTGRSEGMNTVRRAIPVDTSDVGVEARMVGDEPGYAGVDDEAMTRWLLGRAVPELLRAIGIPARDQMLVRAFLASGKSFVELGVDYGLTGSRVAQIVNHARRLIAPDLAAILAA